MNGLLACHAGDKSPNLLEILHAASKAEAPELELLRQADKLQWPILAVLAASHPEASASCCMAVWLWASLRLEGRPSSAHPQACTLGTEAEPDMAISFESLSDLSLGIDSALVSLFCKRHCAPLQLEQSC